MSNKETKLQPELFDLSKEQSGRLDLSGLQLSLFDLPETRPTADDFLRPDGKVKVGRGRKRKKSNQPVSEEQIKNTNNVPSIKGNIDEKEITEYTRWINDH